MFIQLHIRYAESQGKVEIAGKVLVSRRNRDDDAKFAAGVELIAGSIPGWGGSRNRPELNASKDAVIQFEASQEMYDYIKAEIDDSATCSDEPIPSIIPKSNIPSW